MAEEVRLIVKRELRGDMELFVLDSRDLVAEKAEVIPQDARFVRYARTGLGGRIPGICTHGTILEAVEESMVTPIASIRESTCACKLFLGKLKIMVPATDEWLASVSDGEMEIVTIPKDSRIRIYAWCPINSESICFDNTFSRVCERFQPWEYKLFSYLCSLSGYYSVVMAGDKCIGVWNYISSSWMGPPYDRRICKLINIEFAERLEPHPYKTPTLEELRPTDKTLIIRHTYEIGHYVM